MKQIGKATKNFLFAGAGTAAVYGTMKAAAKRRAEDEGIDDDNPYLTGERAMGEKSGRQIRKAGTYESKVKPVFDQILSFGGLLIFSPLYAAIALAIKIDDPGPAFFTQKRVGKDKRFFYCHKFRTMKMCTPHDVPTHQLSDPEQYITRVGRFLRRTSLDELPQGWDIFRQKMSMIGPRPALWNQDDLVAERDKHGANDVLPGLTGWAQINGRDELEIPEKARLDGEYVKHLKQGGWKALFFDVRCFIGTIFSVAQGRGVVEGGTGSCHRNDAVDEADAGFEDYGHLKHFDIDASEHNKKRVLITGADSYVGKSFERWAKNYYPKNFTIDTLDMRDPNWKKKDFSPYDTVLHVAGIAHADVGKVSEEEKKKYYAVNTDLAIETAQKAKADGVKQFILMSSMIIYGESAPYGKEKTIDVHTVPAPANFYGDSKWQADKGVRKLADDTFRVAVLRPPMIYGKGSRGNYRTLVKLAKILPVFPDVENKRSMLYVGNLCEFLCKLMLSGEGGIYFPQNAAYVKTSEMVRHIAKAAGKKIRVAKLLNPAVAVGSQMPKKIGGLVDKAFGNSVYSQKLSRYKGLEYQKISLKDSIEGIEGNQRAIKRKKTGTGSRASCKPHPESPKRAVLMLVNHDVVIYNFRLELVERLLAEGYEVHISSPCGERIDDLIKLGAKHHEIQIERHGMNPVKELRILQEYQRLMKEIKPVIVLGYTIKPNIYGAMVARAAHIPFVANITGLGTAVENGGVKQKLTVLLYKAAFSKVQKVFFQNKENRDFFRKHRIALGKQGLLPGSGVNLERFPFTPLPDCGDGKTGEPVQFAFISRIMKEKGIEQYLDAAEEIKKRYPATEFHVCGFCEEEYDGRLDELAKKGTVIYHGMVRDVAGFMSRMHCIVHPTHYPEGLSNVLLEACACGRAIITTDRAGCREVVEDGKNGYMIPCQNAKGITSNVERFLAISWEEKRDMGKAAREKVEREFDRQIVVNSYIDEIHRVEKQS